MITIRPLTLTDIPNLTQIKPTFRSGSTLDIVRSGNGLEVGWRLAERTLETPYDKGTLYDFTPFMQQEVVARFERDEDSFQRVIDADGRLVGILEAVYEEWNNAVTLWNIHIDVLYRGQGLGRRLFDLAVGFARQMDARALLIETQTNNVPACRFYQRMGCQLVGVHEALYADEVKEIALFWEYRIGKSRATR